MAANELTELFTREDLGRFERLLLDRRRLLLEDFKSLEDAEAASETVSTATHLADLGSDCAASGVSLDCRSSASTEIRQIDDALERIRDGSFGLCESCGRRLSKTRLEAIPYAEFCLSCKIAQEG